MRVHSHLHKHCNTTTLSQYLISVVSPFKSVGYSCFYSLDNKIGDVGAKSLAQALQHNSTLRKLDLSRNSISLSGWKSLVESLENNTTLEYIYLGDDEESRQLFEDAVGLKFLHCKIHGGTLTTNIFCLKCNR